MQQSANQVIHQYAEAYQKLYNRRPSDLRALDNNWVIVNGARMRVTELEYLTHRLHQEYSQTRASRKSVINRLIKWFKG